MKRKYNLSKIMKRAWELVKKFRMNLSEGLKKSWKEAKNMNNKKVKMNVVRKETFVVDAQTGKVTGSTYNAKQFLKDNFNAKWDPEAREWTVDVNKFNSELESYPDYYRKYIVEEIVSSPAKAAKEIVYQKLVNRNDGFYSYVEYTDGTHEYIFIG